MLHEMIIIIIISNQNTSLFLIAVDQIWKELYCHIEPMTSKSFVLMNQCNE